MEYHTDNVTPKTPISHWILFALALILYLVELFSLYNNITATPETMKAAGLNSNQADLVRTLPAWMKLSWGIGAIAGVIGSLLLLLRKNRALLVMAVCLIFLGAVWLGDFLTGRMAAMPSAYWITITVVIVITIALLWIAQKTPT